MVKKEWIDFKTVDLCFDEEQEYTQDVFENIVDDKFEAVELDENGRPQTIWTNKYVCLVGEEQRMGIYESSLIILNRNPSY